MPDFTDEIDFSNPAPMAPMPATPTTGNTDGEIEYPSEASDPAGMDADAMRTAVIEATPDTYTHTTNADGSVTHTPVNPQPVTWKRGRKSAEACASALQDSNAAAQAKRTLIAGLVAGGQGIAVGPGRAYRGVNVAASEFRAALTLGGFGHLAPRLKSSKAQFGEVMRTLNSGGLRAFAVVRKDVTDAGYTWPANCESRWIVGHLSGTNSIGPGTLGDTVLAADLLKVTDSDGKVTYEIDFVGGTESLREKVRREFETRTTEQSYNASNLLNWYRDTLRRDFNSVEWGSFLYIPGTPDVVRPVYALTDCVKPLMGRTIAIGEMLSGESLYMGLGEALSAEVDELFAEYSKALDAAKAREAHRAKRDNAQITDAELEIARNRARPLAGAATSILRKTLDVSARIEGFAAGIGDGPVTKARAQLQALTGILGALVDDTSARFAALEF